MRPDTGFGHLPGINRPFCLKAPFGFKRKLTSRGLYQARAFPGSCLMQCEPRIRPRPTGSNLVSPWVSPVLLGRARNARLMKYSLYALQDKNFFLPSAKGNLLCMAPFKTGGFFLNSKNVVWCWRHSRAKNHTSWRYHWNCRCLCQFWRM